MAQITAVKAQQTASKCPTRALIGIATAAANIVVAAESLKER
jgi:hypothetical protein